MKKIVGSFLIILSIVCIAATVLWVVFGLINQPENPTEDDRTTFYAALLFAGVLVILEIVILLCGRYLRNPDPKAVTKQKKKRSYIHSLALILYLAASLGIPLLTCFGSRVLPETKALAFLIGQPQVLTQLIIAILPGIKLGTGVMRDIIMFAASLLYFLVLFYPVYRIATMNRTVEVTAYKRMKILLILFAGVHILMALVFFFLTKA